MVLYGDTVPLPTFPSVCTVLLTKLWNQCPYAPHAKAWKQKKLLCPWTNGVMLFCFGRYVSAMALLFIYCSIYDWYTLNAVLINWTDVNCSCSYSWHMHLRRLIQYIQDGREGGLHLIVVLPYSDAKESRFSNSWIVSIWVAQTSDEIRII